jgi:hypothetical protein
MQYTLPSIIRSQVCPLGNLPMFYIWMRDPPEMTNLRINGVRPTRWDYSKPQVYS